MSQALSKASVTQAHWTVWLPCRETPFYSCGISFTLQTDQIRPKSRVGTHACQSIHGLSSSLQAGVSFRKTSLSLTGSLGTVTDKSSPLSLATNWQDTSNYSTNKALFTLSWFSFNFDDIICKTLPGPRKVSFLFVTQEQTQTLENFSF